MEDSLDLKRILDKHKIPYEIKPPLDEVRELLSSHYKKVGKVVAQLGER